MCGGHAYTGRLCFTAMQLCLALQVYLHVLSSKHIVGCVVAENITSASPISTSDEVCSISAPLAIAPDTHAGDAACTTPMSAPPLGQHSSPASHSSGRDSASSMPATMTPLRSGQHYHHGQLAEACFSHSRPLQTSSFQRLHAAATMQQSGLAAVHRHDLQHPHKRGTPLTKWLAAGRSKTAVPNPVSDMFAKPSNSAGSALHSIAPARMASNQGQEPSSSQHSSLSFSAEPVVCLNVSHPGCQDSAASNPAECADNGEPARSCLAYTQPAAVQVLAQPAPDSQPASASCSALVSQAARDRQRWPDTICQQPAAAQPSQQQIVEVDKARAVKSMCGIKLIWVSADARRKGIATQLLDAVRCAVHCKAGGAGAKPCCTVVLVKTHTSSML